MDDLETYGRDGKKLYETSETVYSSHNTSQG